MHFETPAKVNIYAVNFITEELDQILNPNGIFINEIVFVGGGRWVMTSDIRCNYVIYFGGELVLEAANFTVDRYFDIANDGISNRKINSKT